MTTFHTALRALHIAMGGIGLISGALSMSLRKGSRPHARAGIVFFASMLLMAASGVLIATAIKPNRGNAMGGLLTIYLVITAWTTVWRRPGEVGRLERAGLMLGGIIVIVAAAWGAMALQQPTHRLDGYPPALFFIFGTTVLLGSLADLRLIARGGVRGAARTVRHLWRMIGAMFLATSSFFLGMASKRFPAVVLQQHLNVIPVAAVLVALVYFLMRVRVLPAWRTRRRALALQEAA